MTGTSPPPARPEGEQRAAAALTARIGYQAKKLLLPALRLGAGKCRFSALKCAPWLATCGRAEPLSADVHLPVGHEPGQCLVECLQRAVSRRVAERLAGLLDA